MIDGPQHQAEGPSSGRRAVFLDRDGTLIVDAGYPRDPEKVELLPGAVEALSAFRQHGLLLVLISNQSGVGRGMVTPEEAASVHGRFVQILEGAGVRLDGSYYCPHGPDDGCTCRKPSPELLQRAAADHGVDLRSSFMIGDKLIDVETGIRAGCKTILLDWDGTKRDPAPRPDLRTRTWDEAARFILSRLTPQQ